MRNNVKLFGELASEIFDLKEPVYERTEAPRYIDPVTLETSWCSGGSCLIRKRALEGIGYFDEKFFLYGEDNDLSWRMWLTGWRCVYVPESICEHHFGKPEKYILRRRYFQIRSWILLRYIYSSPTNILRTYFWWLREGLSLALKNIALKRHLLLLQHR